jgi:thiamine phosphate synthase YjbQ (UPF0047 family)
MTSAKSITRSAPSSVQATIIASSLLTVQTPGRGFTDLTSEAAKFVAEAGARDGALTLFIRHTSASLTIQENAGWTHDSEGPDDMPAHVKTMLTGASLHVPVLNGKLTLGTWQAIYLIEHRKRPHRREVVLQFIGGNQ